MLCWFSSFSRRCCNLSAPPERVGWGANPAKHMKGLLIIYAVFTSVFLLARTQFQPVLSEKDVTDAKGKFTYLTYGMPMEDDYQEAKIAYAKYNLQFIGVAGCMVSEELMDSVKNHNRFVNRLISKRFGYSWYDSLRAQTKREYAYDTTLISTVSHFDFVRERQEKLRAVGNGLHFTVDPKIGERVREISACGYADRGSKWVQYFLFKVDTENKKLISVNKKVVVLE